MKIEKIYVKDLGPINNSISPINLQDTWGKSIHSSVLFSGPNGCGKTILLDSVSYLWEALAYWLERGRLPGNHPIKKWIYKWGGVAIIIDEVPNFSLESRKRKKDDTVKICLFFADEKWLESIMFDNQSVDCWIGEKCPWIVETIQPHQKVIGNIPKPYRDFGLSNMFIQPDSEEWQSFCDNWDNASKRLRLGTDEVGTPNMIYLDSEKRRWINPDKNIGKLIPDDMTKRWLYNYSASEDWKDQLENSLVNYKITAGEKEFHKIIDAFNSLQKKKKILKTIRPAD
ncbi:MAG: hypothetical protein GY765_34565, partial [bacterium]|nr:hypothetical protein [bacterium]